jgi:AcrR family transcriptional regulator
MPKLIDHGARREEIAAAAWQVILREGVSGASVRAVAAEAGLSTGSLRHIFASQSQLLVFAFRLVVDRATARIAALPPQRTALLTAEAVANELLPLDRDRRTEMEVYLALFAAASSDAQLQATRDDALRQMRDACRWMVAQLLDDADRPDEAELELEAARLHAVIDGLAAHLVWMPADVDPDWARQVVARHVRSLGS